MAIGTLSRIAIKNRLTMALLILSVVVVTACGGGGSAGTGGPNPGNSPLKDPQLTLQSDEPVTLFVGQTHTNRATTESDSLISYSSSQPGVAAVTFDGQVTAKTVGSTIITADVIKTDAYQAGSVQYEVLVIEDLVIEDSGTLNLWLEKEGAQWQMPKGFAGAEFYGTTEADCPYEETLNCANATIKTNLDDGALFDDDGNDTTALSLENTLAFYQLTHNKRTAQGLFNAQRWEPRKNHQTVYYNDRFWVVFGSAYVNNQMRTVKDIWSSPDGKNWREEEAFPLQQGRIDHQVVVCDFGDGNGEQLVLIAGNKKNDMWTFDKDRNSGEKWQQIILDSADQFEPRSFHQTVVFNDHLWVIGGLKFDGFRLSDVWFFEPDGEGSGSWKKHSDGDETFPARYQHRAVVFDDKLWVMGGLDVKNNPLNDVWVLDAQEQGWTDVTAATGADQIDPSQRANVELAVYNDRLWLIGGKTDAAGDNSLNDVWSLGKGAGATWQQELEEAPFAARNGHQVVVARDRLWVFGGGKGDLNSVPNQNAVKNDVWSTADGKRWRFESAEGDFNARSRHQVVAFAPTDADENVGRRRLWLVGGLTDQATNDVWSSLDGVNWTLATDTAPFAARYDHSLAEFEGRLWLVGGRDQDDNTIKDAWSSADGIMWQNEAVHLPDDFPALAGSQLVVFDNQLWLFGGEDNDGNNTNEVWSLSQGVALWQSQESSDFPRRRSHQVVVFNDQLLMSGGFYSGRRNDAWVSNDGINWVERSAGSSSLYTARERHQMAVLGEGIGQSLVLIGGTSGSGDSGVFSDIWTSTDGGFNWEQKVSDAPFGRILNHQVVTFNDGTGDKLWLIGGELIGNQIWRSEDGINWQRLLQSDFQFSEPDSSPAP